MDPIFLNKLVAARCQQEQIRDLSPRDLPGNLNEAYDLQDRLHDRLQTEGRGAISGYKIGCTTPVMQQYLEIDHPCAGGVFDSTLAKKILRSR
ncbi:hypothetical protein ACTL6U_10680 [Rhodovibrionaceae bacterium A322]